jgi:acyl carrier protein
VVDHDKNSTMQMLTELIAEHLGVDVSEITAETSFADDLGADSLDVAEIAIAVEDHLGIIIDDAELDHIRTVGQAVEMLESKLSARGTGARR